MKIFFLFLTLLLAGCSTIHEPTLVPIPVKRPAPTVPPAPYLPIYSLNEKSTNANTMKAYVASVYVLRADDEALRTILEGYR